jgi:hypothetical protein
MEMKFDWTTPIGGANPIDLRNALKPVARHPVPLVEHLAPAFGQAAAWAIVTELLNRQWIERTGVRDDEARYLTTEEGLRFVSASPRRYRRLTALAALDGLLERAREVNDCPSETYAYSVARLVVYGSILDPAIDRVGDVDLAYQLDPRYNDHAEQQVAMSRVRMQSRRQGKIFASHFSELIWPQVMVVQRLKRRSPILSLTELDEPWLASRPHRVEIGSPLCG